MVSQLFELRKESALYKNKFIIIITVIRCWSGSTVTAKCSWTSTRWSAARCHAPRQCRRTTNILSRLARYEALTTASRTIAGSSRSCSAILPRLSEPNASFRGFAKLKKFQKSRIKLDRAHPTHQHRIQTFFLETHHWHGQNTQIIITNNF